MARKGTRMIDGREYLLNGTLSGYTPEDTKAKIRAERKFLLTRYEGVRFIRQTSCEYKIYTHGISTPRVA